MDPGAAGFNLLPNASGSLELQLVAASDAAAGPVRAWIKVDGYPITERMVTTEPSRIRLAPRHRGFHFIEVTATDAAGKPAPLGIEVWR